MLFAGHVLAQTTSSGAPDNRGASTPNPWSFSVTADGYVVPHAEFFVSPTFTADRDWLHLEARYIGSNVTVRHTIAPHRPYCNSCKITTLESPATKPLLEAWNGDRANGSRGCAEVGIDVYACLQFAAIGSVRRCDEGGRRMENPRQIARHSS